MIMNVLVVLLFGPIQLVKTKYSLLDNLEKNTNIQSPVPSYYSADVNNVLRCAKLCQYQGFCFLSTFSVMNRRCYLYDMRSLKSEILPESRWILFNTSKAETTEEMCVARKNVYVGNNNGCSWDFRQETQGRCLSINIETNLRPTDCIDVREQGGLHSGVYAVFPNGLQGPVCVFCDQETEGGGWMLIQRRMDGSEDFYRNWAEYENGFGNLQKEFWLGNGVISAITTHRDQEIRIDLEDFEKDTRYAKYSSFSVGDATSNYTLLASGYSGTAGDSLGYHTGQAFTTNDRGRQECAKKYKGGFWYKKCHSVNVNGLYLYGNTNIYAQGVTWKTWRGYYYSLKRTELKIRPSGSA